MHAPQKRRGRFVGVFPEKIVDRRAAQARGARQIRNSAESLGIAPDTLRRLLEQRLMKFFATIKRIRTASKTRPQSAFPRFFRIVEEPHVFPLRAFRRTRGQAVNSGGQDAGEEFPVVRVIAQEKAAIERVGIPGFRADGHNSMLAAGADRVFRIQPFKLDKGPPPLGIPAVMAAAAALRKESSLRRP